jgi:hypothetical protein
MKPPEQTFTCDAFSPASFAKVELVRSNGQLVRAAREIILRSLDVQPAPWSRPAANW